MESSAYIDHLLRLRAGTSSDIQRNDVPAFKLIDGQLRKVKKLIKEQLNISEKTGIINQLLEYMNTCSGKMLRPGLVLLSGSAVNEITDEHLHIAAIFEMIHNATLLHDDVIDDGQRRRGQPTINNLWGNEAAVLFGDFLLSRVFKMCAGLEPRIAKEITATAGRICEGELRQVSESRNWQLGESQYTDIITEKSAYIFGSCCYLGGLLAEGTEMQLQSLRRFGLNAGIAFQITDDLLDIIGDERKTGKTLGSDADKNKLTLALIHLLRAANENEKNAIQNKLSAAGENTATLTEMLRSRGSLEYAQGRAQEFIARAIAALSNLKDSDAKDALIETAKFMVNRAV